MPTRPTVRTALTAFTCVVAAVLALPPLIMAASGRRLSWTDMADIGDAYGGASALLSAVALCAVGASLAYQQRQIRQEMAVAVIRQVSPARSGHS